MNYQLQNEVNKANFNTGKIIYYWPPFMKVVYVTKLDSLDFDSHSSRALAEVIVSCPQTSPIYLVNKPLQAAGMSADNVRG